MNIKRNRTLIGILMLNETASWRNRFEFLEVTHSVKLVQK